MNDRITTESSNQPLVSVVLPCRNEAGHIERCLASVLGQDTPEGGMEIIAADGMSTDGTREYLDDMARRHPQLRVLSNPGRIVSTGLNAAIRAARGAIIVRMDAHTTYASDYVRQCLTVLEQTGADNVGGPMRTQADTFMQDAIRAIFHCAWAVGGARSHEPTYEGLVDTVIYGCWRKSVFDRVGLFDEELIRNQDDEHNLRLIRAGGMIYQSPRIRSWYQVRGSLTALFRQYMQYGYWKVLVIRKHRLPASFRHVVPGAFVGGLCVLLALGLIWRPALVAVACLASAYAIAALGLSLVVAGRTQWRLLPVLPAVMACFHIGYGYGFMRGFLDFVLLHNAPQTQFVQLTREQYVKPGHVGP
jgi:glycosyltransferase involved in cell wall biosynthesis